MTDAEKSAASDIEQMLRGYFVAQALFVAARLSIADRLAAGPRTAAELAHATGVDAEALYRMLRALASEGVFEEMPPLSPFGDARFSLAALGTMLRSDVEGSMRPAALIAGETQYKVWAVFKDTIKHGPPKLAGASGMPAAPPSAFERIFRKPLFEFLADHPDIYTLFNAAMKQRSNISRRALLEACPVEVGDTVVDVGGGLGTILLALLDLHPSARGILFDTPRVIEQARAELEDSPIRSRLSLIAGNFLQATVHPTTEPFADDSITDHRSPLPTGDVIILASVLHMLDDAAALHLLKNCRASLNARGRLVIVESLLRGPNHKDPAKWHDLNMLLMTGGRERTFQQFAELLAGVGFPKAQRCHDIIVVSRE